MSPLCLDYEGKGYRAVTVLINLEKVSSKELQRTPEMLLLYMSEALGHVQYEIIKTKRNQISRITIKGHHKEEALQAVLDK